MGTTIAGRCNANIDICGGISLGGCRVLAVRKAHSLWFMVVRHPAGRVLMAAPQIFLLILLISCGSGDVAIDFGRSEAAPDLNIKTSDREPLRIAVAPVLSVRSTSALYERLAEYMALRLDRPVELVQGKSYAEINDLVKSGDVTVALVCTNPYLQGKDDFGMELLVVPQVNGETVYRSYLIVNTTSTANSLDDLQSSSFAFTDPLSNSGRLVPVYQLAIRGTNAEAFFSQTIFTYSHDSSIRAVANGIVAGAAVDSLVFEYLEKTEPELTAQVRVIERWGPFGINPLVVNPRLDAQTKEALRRLFMEMDQDPVGAEILAHLEIERFVVPDADIYESVREMRAYLHDRGLGP